MFPWLFESVNHTFTGFWKKKTRNFLVKWPPLCANLIASLLTLSVDQISCVLWTWKWSRLYSLYFQVVAQESCKGENIFLLWAIFLYSVWGFLLPITLHPISWQRKENTFKSISCALLKVCIHPLYSGSITVCLSEVFFKSGTPKPFQQPVGSSDMH